MKRANTIVPELIGISDLRVIFGNVSRQWVYDQMRNDPNFPRPVKLNDYNIRWFATEVFGYIASLPRHEFSGLSGPDARAAVTRKRKEKPLC